MTPVEALETIVLRFRTTCGYDPWKMEDIALEGLKGAPMVIPLEQVTEMLSVMAGAYERSRAEGLNTHNAILRFLNNRLLTGGWQPMSLPPAVVYTDGKGATHGQE